MAATRISIAMATYNGERFILSQLQSLARQTCLPYELVVTDDGSTDLTLQIVEEFSAVAPFMVRVHRNDRRLGFADNFLSAASKCRGDIIAFCDQDDIWLESKLSRCAPAFEDPDIVLVVHSGRVVDPDLRPTGALFPRVAADEIHHPLEVDPWGEASGFAMLFRASLPLAFSVAQRPWSCIEREAPMVHDRWVWLLAGAFGKIAFIREPLVLYRRHPLAVTTPQAQTEMQSVRQSLRAGAYAYSVQAELAAQRAELMETAGTMLSDEMRARSHRAAIYYRALQQRLIMRSNIYAPDASIGRRAGDVVSLVAAGGYRSRTHGGFGARALIKDMTIGLFAGPAFRRKMSKPV